MRQDTENNIVQPGEIIVANTDIEINKGRPGTNIEVKNIGDRPIQVGSHFHFFEVNNGLKFDREKAYGKRLDIPAGAAVRFEPGDEKTIQLVEYSGNRYIYGFRGDVDGPIDESRVYKPKNQTVKNQQGEENINKKEGYTQEPKENKDSPKKKEQIQEMKKNREMNTTTDAEKESGDNK